VFQVKNFGAPNTFRFSATDDLRLVTSASPGTFTLGTGESAQVTVQLQVPAGVAAPATDTLTAAVESTATSGARNFAVLHSVVVAHRPPDCSHAAPSLESLWPANHKLVAVSIQGVTSPDGSPITMSVDGISQSESTNGTGDGDTCPDAQGLGTSTAQLRAERSGSGGGRIYSLRFTARSASGGTCQGSVSVCVPHDKNGTCAAPAASFDSTVCP
jgi:hypothetical protein